MNRVAKVWLLLGASVVLISALSLGAGCGQASDQSQALEQQQQENEELQREIEAQQEEQEAAEDQEAAEKQEEMQQKIEDLEEQVEEGQAEPQESDEPETESGSPEVIIQSNEDWTADPSEAPEGSVVVSPDYDVQTVTTEEAYALDAAIAYYQAVEVGDYYETHSLLSSGDKSIYPLDAWVAANTELDSAAGEFVVTGSYPDSVGNGYPAYAVTLSVYLPDGSSFDRTTYFTDEGNGYWAHWLSQEEMDLFNSAL